MSGKEKSPANAGDFSFAYRFALSSIQQVTTEPIGKCKRAATAIAEAAR
jgi:hypothetical protein